MTRADPAGEPIEVLFVCTANISRSAFADLLARHRGPDVLRPSSAGTHARDGLPVDPPMAEELAARGADAPAFRSRRLTPALVEGADVVLTMEVRHRELVLRDRPWLVGKVFTLGQLERTLASIDPGSHGRDALRAAAASRSRAASEDDVADVFGQGRAGAAAAARRIETHLATILPRLGGPGTMPAARRASGT